MSDTDVWVAGTAKPPLAHWNGNRWTPFAGAQPGGALDRLLAIASDDVWAFGTTGSAKGDTGFFALH